MMFRGRKVAVVGGGNTAVADALLLSKICQKVYLIHRRDTLRAEKVYEEALKRADNVELRWNSEVTALRYDKLLTGITLKNKAGEEEALTLDGLFISIGRSPNTALFEGQLKTDKDGYLIADETTRTEIDGVFAVGDVRTKPVRQIVTATADGAVASHYAEAYIAAEQG
jgi:thioredoxin reductase (NADPH)